ncbi:MAG TPA: hypothetical protein VK453_02255 [Micromonosporaceae bacterium]|nr:hypothetical protein [Micromonosporaceae bacterium]
MGGNLVFPALIGLVAVLLVSYLVSSMTRSGDRRPAIRADPAARWQLRHFGDRDETVVTVSLFAPGGPVLDQHVVARIRTEDPEWTARFLEAKEIAEERAFHLNAGGSN